MESLFERGRNSAAQAFPLRAVFRIYAQENDSDDQQASKSGDNPTVKAQPSVKVLISVGKKRFHHATDRNRAKRQIREAFRLQNHALAALAAERHLRVHIAFIWQSSKPVDTSVVFASMQHLLSQIQEKIQLRANP